MNKRVRNLVIMIAMMLLAVVVLCACIAEQSPATEDIVATTSPGYGVDTWDDTEATVENDSSETVETSGQESEDTSETSNPTTEPTSAIATTPTAGSSTTVPEPGSLSYEQFMNMSASDQQAYALAFPSVGDYVTWFNAEKEKYESENENKNVIEITGPIDLGELNN